MEKDTSIAFKNLTALGLVQITNYVLPLLTLPYLTRVLGIENFGLFSFGLAILLYFVIIPDFGFNITTTRKISQAKENHSLLNVIITNTLVAKTFLLLIAFAILIILIVLIPFFEQQQQLFLLGFSIVFAQTYFPMWFFQGIEKLKFITLLNLFSRITLTVLIFFFIKKPEDYVYVIPTYAAGMFVSSVAGIWLMFSKFNVRLKFNQWRESITEVEEGFPMFISSLATTTYNNVGILLMGTFTSPLHAGYYAVADKVLHIFRQLMVVIGQALYPTFYRVQEQGKEKLKILVRKISIPLFIFTAICCLIMFLFPSLIVIVLTGEDLEEIKRLIQFASLLPLIMLANAMFNQILLAYNEIRISMFIVLIYSIISFLIGLVAVQFYGSIGMLITLIIIELCMLCTYLLIVKKSAN